MEIDYKTIAFQYKGDNYNRSNDNQSFRHNGHCKFPFIFCISLDATVVTSYTIPQNREKIKSQSQGDCDIKEQKAYGI